MSVMSVYLTLFNEAKVKFGPVDTWNHYEVGRWMKARMDELQGGTPGTATPYRPKSFTDVEPVVVTLRDGRISRNVEPVEVGRWDDVEDI